MNSFVGIFLLAACARPMAAPPVASCDFGDLVACPAQCEAGSLESCYFHARAISSGIGVPRDQKRAGEMFRSLCERGQADSCNAAAISVQGESESDDALVPALPLYEKACRLGSSKGCNNLGSFLRRGSLGRTSESHGFFVRSCGLDSSTAVTGCLTAAGEARDGNWGVPVDPAAAAQFFARACQLGSESGCASATALGTPSSLSPADAAKQREKNCRRGDLGACHSHGVALKNGKGVGRDPIGAARLFRLVCSGDQGAPRACDLLAELLLDGSLGKVDVVAAIAPLQKGCGLVPSDGVMTEPRAVSCRRLADLTVMGQGVPADRQKAVELYERACSIKAPSGCQQAGALKALEPNATSQAVAQSLFAQGCASGDEESCLALERVGLARNLRAEGALAVSAALDDSCTKSGTGSACFEMAKVHDKMKAFAEARRYFDLGCRAGFARACTAMSGYLEEGKGGPVDMDAALLAIARACALGHEPTCRPAHARIGSTRAFSAQARVQAQKVLDDACANGVAGGCH